jgi:hypothetical protein
MTAVLQSLQDFVRHLRVQTTITPEQLPDLTEKTDFRRLTTRIEELAEPATRTSQSRARPAAPVGNSVIAVCIQRIELPKAAAQDQRSARNGDEKCLHSARVTGRFYTRENGSYGRQSDTSAGRARLTRTTGPDQPSSRYHAG